MVPDTPYQLAVYWNVAHAGDVVVAAEQVDAVCCPDTVPGVE